MEKVCALCGANGTMDPLDKHHIFGGAYRKKSEKFGLVVYLCHRKCHENGKYAVHKNNANNLMFKKQAQRWLMEECGWSMELFRREFGKNYLEGDEYEI